MELSRYVNKTVCILSNNGRTFYGIVSEYFYPDDNESNKESILVDIFPNGEPIEFYEEHIVDITIIDE